jgi:hypothetical protein
MVHMDELFLDLIQLWNLIFKISLERKLIFIDPNVIAADLRSFNHLFVVIT